MPADFASFMLGEDPLESGDSFTVFLHREPDQLLLIKVQSFSSPVAQTEFELLIQDPNFINHLLSDLPENGYGTGANYEEFLCPAELGTGCFGITTVQPMWGFSNVEGAGTVDSVIFFAAEQLVFLTNVFPADSEPMISTGQLALLINEKITTASDVGLDTMTTGIPCVDELGCVIIDPNEPVVLASILCLSGPNKGLGLDSQYGIQLALDGHSDILGHPLKLQSAHDACNIDAGEEIALKLAAQPQIVAIVGPSCSGTGFNIAPILSEAGYSLISPSNTSPSLTSPAYHQAGYLRTAMNDINQSQVMALFAYDELGVRRAAIIHDGDAYTYALASAFRSTFEEAGGTVVAFETLAAEAEDASPLLADIAETEPDMIYFPVFIPLGVLLTNSIPDIPGLEGVILAASDALQSVDFLNSTQGTSDGLYLSGPDFDFSDNVYYEEEFIPAYLEKAGGRPQAPFHAHAFDATNMILEAIEKVGQLLPDGTLVIGRKALRDALFATEDFEGLTGTLTCTEFGDCAAVKVVIVRVQNDEFQPVD